MAREHVTVQYLPDYKLGLLLTAPPHAFVADEPDANGGENMGPTPYELLLWALGACTAMTLLMYARRKEWDVQDISVHLTHDRVHAEDANGAETGTGRVEVIGREISVRGRIDDEQKHRLLEIAGKCPVHRTITGVPKVNDTIVVGD